MYGLIRRTDVALRGEFPDLDTLIFALSYSHFAIFCENPKIELKVIRERLDEIKPVFLHVDIVIEKPKKYIEIIPNIPDSEISKNFEGISFTASDLLNLLMSKFPNIYFKDISQNRDGLISIITTSFDEEIDGKIYHRFLPLCDRKKIIEFVENLDLFPGFEVVDEPDIKPPHLNITDLNPVYFIQATSQRRGHEFKFAQRDEALWFDNIDNIFSGNFKKEQLFFYRPNDYSSFVDYSVFQNIDLRNFIFLYQTVYVALPFREYFDDWLRRSNISRQDLVEVIERGRIKIVLVQPEYRYDIGFINEIYHTRPDAVISRRALAALQQIDIVDIADNYIFNDKDSLKEVMDFSKIIGTATDSNPQYIYNLIVWPLFAKRKSFNALNSAGYIGTSTFGVNNVLAPRIHEFTGKDLELEFQMASSAVHLSNALNASYFPYNDPSVSYTDAPFVRIMGDLLNFYRYANIDSLKTFLKEKEAQSFQSAINPVDVISIPDSYTLPEVEGVLSKHVIFPGSKRLMETLSELDENQRREKITFYNNEVVKQVNKNKKSKFVIDLAGDVILDGTSAITGIPSLLLSLFRNGISDRVENFPLIRAIHKKIEDLRSQDIDKANIHYLAKINRVARINRRNTKIFKQG